MRLKVRSSKNNEWCFVEEYKVYRYKGKGFVTILTGVTQDKSFTSPYVLRGEEFIPLKEIDETIGIAKYIKAKKPFYSKLGEGFVVRMKLAIDFKSGEYFPDDSSFEVFSLNNVMNSSTGELYMKSVLNIPEPVKNLMADLMKEAASFSDNREEFLRSRTKVQVDV